jgi:hypothetical protein
MYLSPIAQKRVRTLFLITCLLAFLLSGVACKRTAENNANGNASNANASAATDDTSSTPPFQTKEPERYQATMITSGSLGGQAASIPGLSSLTNQQMLVARDGEKRRVETEMFPGVKITYLQLAGARYLLYPAKKLYAEIKLDGSDASVNPAQGVPSDFAPDKLVKGATTGAKYEKLGTEEVNGRTTTKYRVTGGSGDESQQNTETIIWVDESLGMPIKSESTSTSGAKYSMELRDIKQEVDATLFELPKDYQKVEHKDILSKILPSLPDFLGSGNDNKKGKKP